MLRLMKIILLTSTCITMMIGYNKVSATSWAEIDPQEVKNRAKVIVSGTYDFSSESKPSEFIFKGLKFNVNKIYQGDVPIELIAGIDMFDVGWAEEFQDEGGEFLLFLEENEKADFLLPVGGPNGMVQISKGKVEHHSKTNIKFYEEILKMKPKTPNSEIGETGTSDQGSNPISLFLISGGALVSLLALVLLVRYLRKR
ncbi:hypothetical protein ACFSFY_16845 [Sporosarcina siberiensis]|uniref:LPXTG-motif cell wall anchor domain-containing protein n=1 Tax=Sporosarcina siberiensis TaxID=1365606 RepID=A0ABW4SKM1_9BACL